MNGVRCLWEEDSCDWCQLTPDMDADQKDWAWIVWKCVPCTKKGSWVRTVICCAQKGMLLSSHALDVWCARLTQTHTEKEDDQHEHVALHEASRRFTKTRPRENSTSEMRSGSQVLIAEEGSKEAVEAHNEVKLLQVCHVTLWSLSQNFESL